MKKYLILDIHARLKKEISRIRKRDHKHAAILISVQCRYAGKEMSTDSNSVQTKNRLEYYYSIDPFFPLYRMNFPFLAFFHRVQHNGPIKWMIMNYVR